MQVQILKRYYTPEEYLELKDYILIDQARYHVMQHTKTLEGKWLLTEHESEEAVLELSSIEFQINLSEIYEKVNFEEGEE
jgi:Uma2 family endonuclease